jgi:signal transduction histidine kinase
MEQLIPWVLVAAFAALAAFLAFRKREDPYPDALARLRRELEEGSEVEATHADDPADVAQIRGVLARGWKPVVRSDRDPGEAALEGLVRYLSEAVLAPLSSFQASGQAATELETALNALEDLSFYAVGSGEGEPISTENLSAVIQGVTREYALETGVPVKFRGPSGTIPVEMATEAFKDALFLVMANAGRFSGGKTVEVSVEPEGDWVRIRVRDRGRGFTPEALDNAFLPFWTSDSDALGLGLTHAGRLLERQGGRIAVGNAEGGGGEVVISLPRTRPGSA